MVPDSESSILETVRVALHGAMRLDATPLLAGDSLKDLGLSRLRLLAVLIELEDKFDIEFPTNAVDCFRLVRDIAVYIQSHAMIPCDDADDRRVAASHPIERLPARARLHQLCARALCRVLAIAGSAPG